MEQEILSLLQEHFPEIDFNTEEKLVDGGILSSLAIVSLIAIMSEKYKIVIPFTKISAENFNSVKAISKLVVDLQKEE